MSVVIAGGHDRLVFKYKQIAAAYNFKVKVFTQLPTNFKKQIGTPNLIILFTNTVSHNMVHCAISKAVKAKSQIIRSHNSSATALIGILSNFSLSQS